MSDKEKELTEEELENAAGGLRARRANQPLGEGGQVDPPRSSGGPTIGGVEPLPDPPKGGVKK